MGHRGQHEHDGGAFSGEAQHLVLGDVLHPLVIPVKVSEVGDVVLVRRRAGLRAPEPKGRHRRGEGDAFDTRRRGGTDDVAAADDVDVVEDAGSLGQKPNFAAR